MKIKSTIETIKNDGAIKSLCNAMVNDAQAIIDKVENFAKHWNNGTHIFVVCDKIKELSNQIGQVAEELKTMRRQDDN